MKRTAVFNTPASDETTATELCEDEYSDSDTEYGSDDHSIEEGDDDIASDFEEDGDSKPTADPYMLLRAGAPIADPKDPVNRSKLKELIGECQHALSSMTGESNKRTIEYTTTNNKPAAAVWMTKADYSEDAEKGDKTFQRVANNNKLAESIATAVGGKDHAKEGAYSVILNMGKKYKSEFIAATRTLKVGTVPERMTPEYCASILDDAGITPKQMRMIKRKVEGWLPDGMKPLFPTEREVDALSEGYLEPTWGEPYKYKAENKRIEKIEWWWKPVNKAVELYLKRVFGGAPRGESPRPAHDRLDRDSLLFDLPRPHQAREESTHHESPRAHRTSATRKVYVIEASGRSALSQAVIEHLARLDLFQVGLRS